MKFLNETQYISPQQFGFLPQSNTTSATIHAVSLIQKSLDESKITTATFTDIAKAFDSVDHANKKIQK